jgi:aminoglycoside N3'-acetyltransferase
VPAGDLRPQASSRGSLGRGVTDPAPPARPLGRDALVTQLRALGVDGRVPLMVHASLRRLGPVEGGAEGVIDALLEALAPGGTLVFPLGSEGDEPFDPITSRAERDIGTLAEIFRSRPETRVNDHPAARFGAIGPQADAILEPIPLHDYYAPASPLDRFTRMGGRVLRLSADPDTVTATHLAEYLADLPEKRRVRRRYLLAGGEAVWIEGLDDVEGIAKWAGGDYFPRIWLDFRETEAVRTAPVGGCTGELFDASPFVEFAARWMEERL